MATPTRFPDAKRRSATLSRRRHGRRHQAARLALEPLEVRWLPSTTGVQLPPAETINLADNLGTLGATVQASGSIGGGPQGAADVAWYHFQLGQASQVDLTVRTPAGDSPFASVISLFNSDPNDAWNPYGDPNAYGDPYDPTGHRLMDQVQANPGTGTARLVQDLSPGDYYVAISGAGNLDFSPFVAGSGFDGATGSYVLSASTTSLGLANSGPTMIASDPAAGAVLNSSPLAIRVAMSAALDPNTLNLGQDVQLLSLPAGGGPASPVTLAGINFSAAADELQLYPQAPLAPGSYEVLLLGNAIGGGTVLAGLNGSNLGQDAQHPQGANESFTFQVNGVDGVAGATASDNTAATAQQLGDITGAGLVRVTGAIGVDPSFNPGLSFDPMFPDPWNNPANQVDLYHFNVAGPGRFMLLADASAGLIGSPLDPGLSVWKLDPATGRLDFVAGNNNTGDPTRGVNRTMPLYADSALSAGLTAGDYYIAVANGSNTPSPLENQPAGSPGLFDPNQPGSAQNGMTTGPYVLDLMVAPAPPAPTVVESSPFPGQALGSSPTQVTVQFSGPMDMQSLTFQPISPEFYILDANGTTYFPRLLNYDHTTNTATFQMLDGLPNGSYTLHLSGPSGLANLGGVPLVGNSPGGDYVVPFTVNGPSRGITGNPTQGYTIVSQYGGNVAQQVGVLFPDELVAGVTIVRAPESAPTAPSPPEDRYAIKVLQNQLYVISFSGSNLPAGLQVTVIDASGREAQIQRSFFGTGYLAALAAGSYTIVVSGWPADQTASVSYDLTIQLYGSQDNAPPLVDGPAPAIQIALAGLTPTSSPSTGGIPSTGGVPTVGSDPGGVVPGPLSSGAVTVSSGTTGGTTGGPGVEGTTSTGTSAASPSVSLAMNEAASGLSGLGMSPLGGSTSATTTAGTTGASSPGTIQVVLGGATASSPTFGRLALSLVTLTSVISTNHDGQEVQATDLPNPSVDTDEQPPADLRRTDTSEENPAPAAAGMENDRSQGAPAAVPGLPSAPPRPQPSRGPAPTTPSTGPAATGNVSAGSAMPAAPAGDGTAAVPGDAVAAPIADRPRPGSRAGLARLMVAGTIAAAAFRHHSAIRGLHWRKGALSTWWRLDGASPAAPHPGRASQGGRAAGPNAVPTQCDSTIEVPGR